MRNDELHDLHIEISNKMREELLELLPNKGMISILVRRFLASYIEKVNDIRGKSIINNPIDSVIKDIVIEDIQIGLIDCKKGGN
jgi:hypothetical protein